MSQSEIQEALRLTEELNAQRKQLEDAQLAAEAEVLDRLAASYLNGEMTLPEVYPIFLRLKALGMLGWGKRWDAHFPIPWKRMEAAHRNFPNAPAATWRGEAPLRGDQGAPPEGTPVVYVLFDRSNEPCYVGSTANLRQRLKGHLADGKDFASWHAFPCATREEAYQLEERLIDERRLRLNRRRGR